jgi:hypothetical protein
MFSRSREKTRTRSEKACASPGRLQGDFPGAGDNKRMKDQAARVCRALCRTSVVAEMHQRRGPGSRST